VELSPGKAFFDEEDLRGIGLKGGAVLLCSGHSDKFGTDDYGKDSPYLSDGGAQYLMDRGVVFVGIDTPLIDKIERDSRPVHDIILRCGAVVCEDMTNLKSAIGLKNAVLTAVPPKVKMASFTARVFIKILE
jgi:kynurenine formamidase